jgi:hypothetical protein
MGSRHCVALHSPILETEHKARQVTGCTAGGKESAGFSGQQNAPRNDLRGAFCVPEDADPAVPASASAAAAFKLLKIPSIMTLLLPETDFGRRKS